MKEQAKEKLLLQFESGFVEELMEVGRLKKAKANQIMMSPDTENTEIPFVINGLMRVVRNDNFGNELFLYYLEPGSTCAMSVSCCLDKKQSGLSLIAEEDSQLWMAPMYYIDRWVVKYLSFRKYIFKAYQDRFEELIYSLDSIAFLKMDERILNYLLDKKQASGTYEIHTTHEKIAKDLNSSRVVISRLLKQMEREEKVILHRNKIEIL